MYQPKELGIISTVVQITSDQKPRQFPIGDLVIATAIFNKLKSSTEKDIFIESEVDFTSEEKVFISKLVNEFSFPVVDGESVASLLEKIK